MFAFLLLVCLTIPGWSILKLCTANQYSSKDWFFFPVISLGYFIFLFLVYNYADLSYKTFSISYFAVLAVVLAASCLKNGAKVFDKIKDLSIEDILPPLVILIVLVLYALWAGAYVEIPGDPIWHMARITDAAQVWREETIKPVTSLFSSGNYYWYKFCGWLLHLSGSTLSEQLNVLWTVNFIVFTAIFYSFAKTIFEDSELNANEIVWAGAIAVFFLVLHYGIGPFSYVRYYAFAPGYFAMTGYWAIIVLVWRYLSGNVPFIYSLIFASILTLITALLHHQEVMYALLMSAAIISVMFVREVAVKKRAVFLNKVSICFVLLIVCYLSIHIFLYLSKVRNYPLEGGWIIPLNELLPFVDHLYILKPDWQFYQVLTVFGIWAYVVYFFNLRNLKLPVIVVAGLWIPFFTVFNPIFVDLFLRVSYPEVLWRICYVVPFALFMAYMLVRWLRQLLDKTDLIIRVKSALLILVTISLLFPFNFGFIFNQYDKLTMLKPMSAESDHRQMQDMLDYLNTRPVQNVLTDQVTGYLVNALTEHEYLGAKFYALGTLNTNRQELKLEYFKDYDKGMLVLNFRQGSLSDVGRISGHWGESIRNYSRYYSPAFIKFVESHSDNFELVKQFADVKIYKIDLAFDN